jgi:hypothetical protein
MWVAKLWRSVCGVRGRRMFGFLRVALEDEPEALARQALATTVDE